MNPTDYLHALSEREREKTRVAHATGDSWSVWHEPDGAPFNYRTIFRNEIILESDFDDREINLGWAERVANRLRAAGLTFSVWFSGNKSFHVQKFVRGLESLDDAHLARAKTAWAKIVLGAELFEGCDPANFRAVRMVGAEWAPHRLTGKLKTLVSLFPPHVKDPLDLHPNAFPASIIETTRTVATTNSVSTTGGKIADCGICTHALDHELVRGERHRVVWPNFLALDPTDAQVEQLAATQNTPVDELRRWQKSKAFKHAFNCHQLQKFGERAGLRRICDVCLLRNGTIRREGRYARMQNY